jgi:hypothetical protein
VSAFASVADSHPLKTAKGGAAGPSFPKAGIGYVVLRRPNCAEDCCANSGAGLEARLDF